MIDKDQVILDIVRTDPRFRAEAYEFVFEALDHTLRRRGGARKHVSGPEIMESVRQLALESFGMLARTVLEQWGVRRTDDFGDVVFNRIEADLLQKTANDKREDFCGLYDFSRAFEDAFQATLASVEI